MRPFPTVLCVVLIFAIVPMSPWNSGVVWAQGVVPKASCCDRSDAIVDKPFWPNLFDTTDFPQRWYCGHWSPFLGWLHIIADLAIWGAYTAIPIVLCFFIRRRKDMPFPMIFWLFSVFILACGTGHFVEATIFWQPWYRLSALVKVITALVSWITVAALIPVLPEALALPGLAKINQELQKEIVDRQRADEALRRAKESLEKKNRRLAELYQTAHQLVDNVSHEFRTPLTVVKEFSSIIRDGLAGEVNLEQREYLDIVMSRVDDLTIMVEDMLDIGKIEAGVLGVCRQDARVEEIIDHLRPVLERKAAMIRVPLDIDLDETLPSVYCDPEKIGRVLINLVVNALKFARDGGHVRLWCRSDLVRSEVVVGVTDDGPGIAAENLQVIFDRFKQIKGDPRASTKGFGLGLNIARELVHLNFGDIRVESVLGKGSTFSFSIPTADRLTLIRRYLQHVEKLSDGPAEVSLVRAEVRPTVNRERSDDVEQFLQHQLRCNDLLFQILPYEWLLVVATDSLSVDQFIVRLQKVQTEFNRNCVNGPMPAIILQPEGTWRIPLQRDELLRCLESTLCANEVINV